MAHTSTKADKEPVFTHPNAVHVYVDGSFRPPDNASCAYLIYSPRKKEIVKIESFAFRGSTINQMELQAINKALDCPGTDYVIIHSDSAYSIACLTIWRKAWAAKNWIGQNGLPVKNRELIEEIGKKIDSKRFVRFAKVKAHSGDPYNSVVDFVVQALSAKMRDDPKFEDGAYSI